MDVERELSRVYAKQAERAGWAAVIVAGGGGVASLALAATVGSHFVAEAKAFAFLGVLGFGFALTAAVYAVVSALQAHAQAAAARHLDLATRIDADSPAASTRDAAQ